MNANYAFDPVYALKVLRPIEVNRYKILEISNNGTDFAIINDYNAMLSDYGKYELQQVTSNVEYVTHRTASLNPYNLISKKVY